MLLSHSLQLSLQHACNKNITTDVATIATFLRTWDLNAYKVFSHTVPTNGSVMHWNTCNGFDPDEFDTDDQQEWMWTEACSGVVESSRTISVARCKSCKMAHAKHKRKRQDSNASTPGKTRLKSVARIDASSHANLTRLCMEELVERCKSKGFAAKKMSIKRVRIENRKEKLELESAEMDVKMQEMMLAITKSKDTDVAWKTILNESIDKLVFTKKMSEGALKKLQDKVLVKSDNLLKLVLGQMEVMARDVGKAKKGMRWDQDTLAFAAVIGNKTHQSFPCASGVGRTCSKSTIRQSRR